MGETRQAAPVKLFCGMIYKDEAVAAAAREALVSHFGKIECESEVLPFDFTDYYTPEMGPGLSRRFVAFAERIDPSDLVKIKHETDAVEKRFLEKNSTRRRVNLDPGYLDSSKIVLASNMAGRLQVIKEHVPREMRIADCGISC